MKLSHWSAGKLERVYIETPFSWGITLWAEQVGMNDYKLKYKPCLRCEKSKWSIECLVKDMEMKIGYVSWSYLVSKAEMRGNI